jgi:hypothetical protein
MFIALALIAIAGGTLFTYLYDEGAPLISRLSAGACMGFGALGLIGFVLASFLGLTPLCLLLTAAALALPSGLLSEPKRRARVFADVEGAARGVRRAILYPSRRSTLCLILYALIFILLWLVYERAMFEQGGAIYTGLANNYGDLPFHLSVITSFVKGGNFPPEDPTYAGARFTYPFLADFIAACFVRAGASLRGAMLLENLALALALTGLLYRWALLLTRDRAAAHLSPVLLLLSGGLGWWLLFDDAWQGKKNILAALLESQHDYTIIPESIYRWGNGLTTLLVPQRSMLLGLPLALVVFIQWWQVFGGENEDEKGKEEKRRGKKRKRAGSVAIISTSAFSSSLNTSGVRRMLAAGLVAGLLPLSHAHTFIVVMMVGSCLALIQGSRQLCAREHFFRLAVWLGSRRDKRALVLVCKHWAVHTAARCGAHVARSA